MRKILPILITLLTLTSMSALLSACNTAAGAGRDISATGHAITNGADRLMA
jgi:entericidin B